MLLNATGKWVFTSAYQLQCRLIITATYTQLLLVTYLVALQKIQTIQSFSGKFRRLSKKGAIFKQSQTFA
jgi:hypothetical protein